MTALTYNAKDVFAPTNTSGVARGADMSEARVWGSEVEALALSGAASGGAVIFDTLATANASLAYAANSMAWIVSDSTAANNGIYRKIGGSGSGSWSRIGDLPYAIVPVTASGGPNDIIGTSSIPAPTADRSALYIFTAPANNTGAMRFNLNGAGLVTLRDKKGSELTAGQVISGETQVLVKQGGQFRLLYDANFAALAASATASAASAAASVDSVLSGGPQNVFATVAALEAATVPGGASVVRVLGVAAAGNEALLSKRGSTPSPVEAWHVQSDDGAYWEVEQVEDFVKWLVDSGVTATGIHAAVGRYITAKGRLPAGTANNLESKWDEPLPIIVNNGDFNLWTTRPTRGGVQTAGSGVGFNLGQIADGWYGGPGPASQYTFTNPIDDAATGERRAVFTWNASVAAGEDQHLPAKRFTFLEYIGLLPPRYMAGENVTIEFEIKASSALDIVPIGWLSMGNSSWAASTVYVASDIRINGTRLYTCTTGGTSASSGGPTGTGTGITDGTVIWNYLGELKGREYELFEASGTPGVVAVANGAPDADAICLTSTSWQRFKKTVYIPALNAVNSTTYSGHASDTSRTLTTPQNGGYFGIGFDLHFTGTPGPTIEIRRVNVYRGTKAPQRPMLLPDSLIRYLTNPFSLLLTTFANAGVLLNARNSPFAAGYVTVSGTTPTLVEGYGLTVTYGGSTGRWRVDFPSARANGNYKVSVSAAIGSSSDATTMVNWNYASKSGSGFDLWFSSSANPEAFANPISFDIIVTA